MRLPEKVQRKNFTREEQILLSSHFEGAIPDAADEILYKLRHQRNQSVPTLSASRDSSESSMVSIEKDLYIEPKSEMEVSTVEGFRWMEDEEELDLSLDDYHAHLVPTTDLFPKSRLRRSSFRRSLSLTSLPFGSAKSSAKDAPSLKPVDPPPTLPPLSHQSAHHRAHSKDPYLNNAKQRPVGPSTKHYQDPEARLKLRVYLASPQKFDEALEFGFPSLDDEEILPVRRPSISNHYAHSILHTFLNEDSMSFFSSHDSHGTETSASDFGGPENSSTTFFHDSDRLQNFKPTSSGSNAVCVQQHVSCSTSEPYAHMLAGSREMTIRMTLTRPDLRANEDRPDAAGDDPLALEHLLPVRNAGESWELYPKQGMMKKIWHKMSRKTIMPHAKAVESKFSERRF